MTDRELLIEACHRIKALAFDVERVYMPAAKRLDPFRDLDADKASDLLDRWHQHSPCCVMFYAIAWLDDGWIHEAPEEADRILNVLRRNDVIALPESVIT